MATDFYFCNVRNVSRGKGASALAALSYITGLEITDEKTGETFDYTRKERILSYGTELPEGAPDEFNDAEALFKSVEENEKGEKARLAKRIIVAFPNEIKELELKEEFAKRYIKEVFTDKNYAATWAIHEETDKDGNAHNPHLHILVPDRMLKNGKWQAKEKSVYKYEQAKDENGKEIFEDVPVYVEDKNKLDENGEPQKVQKLNKNGEPEYEKKPVYVLDENGKPKRIPIIDKNTGLQKVDARNRKQWKKKVECCNPISKTEFLTKIIRPKWAEIGNEILRQAGFEGKMSEKSHKQQAIEKGLDPADAPLPEIKEGYGDKEVKEKRRRHNRLIKKINEGIDRCKSRLAELIYNSRNYKDRALTTDIEDNSIAESQSAPPVNTVADFSESVNPAVSPAQPEHEAADLTPERQEPAKTQPVIPPVTREEKETPEMAATAEKVTVENAHTSAEVEPEGIKLPPETEEKEVVAHQSDREEKDLPEIPEAAEIESASEHLIFELIYDLKDETKPPEIVERTYEEPPEDFTEIEGEKEIKHEFFNNETELLKRYEKLKQQRKQKQETPTQEKEKTEHAAESAQPDQQTEKKQEQEITEDDRLFAEITKRLEEARTGTKSDIGRERADNSEQGFGDNEFDIVKLEIEAALDEAGRQTEAAKRTGRDDNRKGRNARSFKEQIDRMLAAENKQRAAEEKSRNGGMSM